MKQQEIWSIINNLDQSKLAESLIHDDGRVRELAAKRIGVIRDATFVNDLIHALAIEDTGDIRFEIIRTLNNIGEVSIQPLLEALKSDDEDVRYAGASGLCWVGSAEVISMLCKATEDPTPRVRAAALRSLWNTQILTPEVEEKILACLEDDDSVVVEFAILAAGELGCSAAVPRLISLLDPPTSRRDRIIRSLGNIGDDRAVEILCKMLIANLDKIDASFDIHEYKSEQDIAEALGKIADPRAVVPVIDALIHCVTVKRVKEDDGDTDECNPMISEQDRSVHAHLLVYISEALFRMGESSIAPLIETLRKYAVIECEDESLKYCCGRPMSVTREVSHILSKMDHSVVGQILKLLEDENSAVRKAAVDCLTKEDVEDKTVRDVLITRIFNEADGEVKRQISWFLRKGGLSSFDDLVSACDKMNRPFTHGEIDTIRGICDASLRNITSYLADPDGEERQKRLALLRDLISAGFTLSQRRESERINALFGRASSFFQ